MNSILHKLLIIMTLLLSCSTALSTVEPPPLQHNPFSRPMSKRTIETDRLQPGTAQNSINMNLLATMVSSGDRLANVDGNIVRQGDEINGYTLLQIFEDRAIFGRNDKQTIVHVKPQLVNGNGRQEKPRGSDD